MSTLHKTLCISFCDLVQAFLMSTEMQSESDIKNAWRDEAALQNAHCLKAGHQDSEGQELGR